MSSAALTFSELLQYTESEYSHWREWFKKNPAALEVKTDIAETSNVRQLVLHIVAVDLRYAERLLGEDVTTYDKIPNSCEGLFGTADVALKKMQRFVAKAGDHDWQKKVTFWTMTAGRHTASKRNGFRH